MKQDQWIAYAGVFPFPEGNACAQRVMGISQSLAAAGHRVVVLAGECTWSEPKPLGVDQLTGALSVAGTGEYQKQWSRWRKLRLLLHDGGKATVAWLESQPTRPAAVILYGTSEPFLRRLLPWCRKNKVRLIVDVVEWYDGGHVLGGRFGPVHVANEYAMRILTRRCDGIIGISRFLCDYYAKSGCRVIRIPPTLDVQAVPFGRGGRVGPERIQLLYAGVPGKKDLIRNVISALSLIDPAGRRFALKLIGPTDSEIHRLCPDYSKEVVHAVGRRRRQEVLEAAQASDFTVLLRHNRRYANAGFPTKVVESLSCGTPVIGNLTSNLGDYLEDGRTAIVCHDESAAACKVALERAASLSVEQRLEMRHHSRACAERAFDYREHIESIDGFIRTICGGTHAEGTGVHH